MIFLILRLYLRDQIITRCDRTTITQHRTRIWLHESKKTSGDVWKWRIPFAAYFARSWQRAVCGWGDRWTGTTEQIIILVCFLVLEPSSRGLWLVQTRCHGEELLSLLQLQLFLFRSPSRARRSFSARLTGINQSALRISVICLSYWSLPCWISPLICDCHPRSMSEMSLLI